MSLIIIRWLFLHQYYTTRQVFLKSQRESHRYWLSVINSTPTRLPYYIYSIAINFKCLSAAPILTRFLGRV